MSYVSHRRMAAFLLVLAVLGGAACSDDSSSSSDPPEGAASEGEQPAAVEGELADGPVTVVAVGDSLTYGEGDENGEGGFVGQVTAAIAEEEGRGDSTLENFGISGWTSDMVVNGEGEGGAPGQLPQAVDAITQAAESGNAVLATVLIGSNDMWLLYEYGTEEGTSAEAEQEAVEIYRTNLSQTVSELQDAGALVVVGLPDDQSIRPAAADIEALNQQLPNVTEEEVEQMSALSETLGAVTEEVAAELGVATVDTNGDYWADPSTMADDGIHPNAAGYGQLADQWLEVIQPAL